MDPDGLSIFDGSKLSSLLMFPWSAVPVAFMVSKSEEKTVDKLNKH